MFHVKHLETKSCGKSQKKPQEIEVPEKSEKKTKKNENETKKCLLFIFFFAIIVKRE